MNQVKTVFVHAKSTLPLDLPLDEIKKLAKPVGVVVNIQYLHRLQEIVDLVQGVKVGQVLGCHTQAADKVAEKVSCFLFVGSGRFHPIGVALNTQKPVYCFDPATHLLDNVTEDELELHRRRKKGALLKFLHSTKVGVLVSTKSGQNLMHEAITFKSACKDKEVYLFAFETLDRNYLDNFTFIESWVNTSCPRIPETDNPGMVNMQEVLEACPQYGWKGYHQSPFLEKTLKGKPS